jgi:adenylate cyclase
VIRRIRLMSGLILFSYLVTHFFNHALCIISLETADAFKHVVYLVITTWPATTLLLGALVVHFLLALWALWERRSLRLRPYEALQYGLGFLVPLLLVQHVMGTRVADRVFGADIGYYAKLMVVFWHLKPMNGVLQAVLVLTAWTHACIGLRFWLRLRPWYDAAQPFLFAGALLLPTLALAGYVAGGREATMLMTQDPDYLPRVIRSFAPPEAQPTIAAITDGLRIFFLASLAVVLLARALRRAWQRRRGLVRIRYPDGRFIDVVRGTSVLEASRLLGFPHASICGGRGRCSTCRVRVRTEIDDAVEPPSADEERVLRRVGAAPNVRLACQLRPAGPVEVTPLLPAFVPAREGLRRPGYAQGSEREIAILFADLRGFTSLAEKKLPYDIVFVLNRYFQAMGEAIGEAGGRVDKFIGDGVMALFGVEQGVEAGCRMALVAARRMSLRIDELNRVLQHELEAPLRIGIGLHAGPAIVGEMGYGKAMALTAVGDAVNTASRLEAACKAFACELVVSEVLLRRAGADPERGERHELEIRGRREPLAVRVFARARDLPDAAASRAAAAE